MKRTVALILIIMSIIMMMSGCVGENLNKNLYNLVLEEKYVEALNYVNENNIDFDVDLTNQYDKKTKNLLLDNITNVYEKLNEMEISYEEANSYGELTFKLIPAYFTGIYRDEQWVNPMVDLGDLLEKMSKYNEHMDLIKKEEYLKGLNGISSDEILENDKIKSKIISQLKELPVDSVRQHIDTVITTAINSEDVYGVPNCFVENKEIIHVFLNEQEVEEYISLINSTDEPKRCKYTGCNMTKKDEYNYCFLHLCHEDGCGNGTSSNYCSVHMCVKEGCSNGKAASSSLCETHLRKKQEGVRIGMSKQDVLDSSWGSPRKINKTTNSWGTREQWVYGNGNYLYFEDDRLTSIQN